MITNLAREQLIEIGYRLRGGHLLQQAGYTLALAQQEGAALEAALPQGFLADFAAARAEVEQGLSSRANVVAEAKDSTRIQNETLRRAREWRRRVSAVARMAERSGQPVPGELIAIGGSMRSVPTALQSAKQIVGLLESSAKLFEAFPLYEAVLGEGENLVAALGAADATQEHKRLSDLPQAAQGFYAAKGKLYVAIKMVNDAGRALLAGDVASASRFNMSILYRRPGTSAASAASAVVPQPAPAS